MKSKRLSTWWKTNRVSAFVLIRAMHLRQVNTNLNKCRRDCRNIAVQTSTLGHNLKTEDGFNKMMTEFEDVVGIKYLKAVHLNDSNGSCVVKMYRPVTSFYFS